MRRLFWHFKFCWDNFLLLFFFWLVFCWENKSSTYSQRNCTQKDYWINVLYLDSKLILIWNDTIIFCKQNNLLKWLIKLVLNSPQKEAFRIFKFHYLGKCVEKLLSMIFTKLFLWISNRAYLYFNFPFSTAYFGLKWKILSFHSIQCF